MGFCTHGSRSLPCLLARKSSLVYFLRLSGTYSSQNLGWIILLCIFFRLSTVYSLSIGGRYVVWINSLSFFFYRIIGIVSFLVFLLLLLPWRANNFFFL